MTQQDPFAAAWDSAGTATADPFAAAWDSAQPEQQQIPAEFQGMDPKVLKSAFGPGGDPGYVERVKKQNTIKGTDVAKEIGRGILDAPGQAARDVLNLADLGISHVAGMDTLPIPGGLHTPLKSAAEAIPAVPHVEGMQGTLADKLGQGLGFIGTAAIPGALGVRGAMALAPAVVMGAASNGVAMHQRVLQETGDPDRAMLGLLAGAGVGGGLSLLPVARVLARINGASGGVLVRALGDAGTGVAFGVGQRTANNVIEKYAGKQDIPILQGAAEDGALGALTMLIAGPILAKAGRSTDRAPAEEPIKPIGEAPNAAEVPNSSPAKEPAPIAEKPVEPQAAQEQAQGTASVPGGASDAKSLVPDSAGSRVEESAAPTPAEPRATKIPLRLAEPKPEEAPKAERLPVKAVESKPSTESLGLTYKIGGVSQHLADLFGVKPPTGGKVTETIRSPEEGFYPSPETKFETVQRKIADRFVKLRSTEQEAPGKGSDFSGAETRMHGRAAHAQDLLERQQDRAVKLLKNAGMTAQDIADYATARHAETRNKIIEERTGGENKEGSGMSAARAREVLDNAKPAAEQAMKIHDEVRDKALSFAVESGLLSADEAAAWKDKFGDTFTSLKTIGEEEPRSMPGVSKSLQVRGKEAKRAEGRGSEATNPFVSMFQNAQDVILRGEKNIVAQEFGKLVKQNPGPWAEFEEPAKSGLAPSGEDVFTYKENGEPKYIRVRDAGTLKAIKNLDPVAAGTLLRMAAKAGRLMSGLATSRNPDFIASNLARDLQTAVGNVTAEESVKTAAKIVKNVPAALKEMHAAARHPEAATGYAKEYLEHGALTDWIEPSTPQKRLADMEKRLAETPVKEKLRALADAVSDISESVENGTRFAYFKALREAGVSADAAAVRAKELTVNWSKKGEWSSTMNALYLFSSASANGTVRFAQAWVRNPQRAAAYAGTLMAAGYALAAINHAAGGKDPKSDRDWIDEQSDANKRRNALIQHQSGSTTRLPLAPGWGWFVYLGGKAYDAQQTKSIDLGDVIGSAVEQASPIGGGSLAQVVSPWWLDPFVSASENKDFAGRPIYTDRDSKDKRPYYSLPVEQKRGTETSKAISKLANELTGGNEARQGSVDIPPRALDYVAAESGSGLGRFMQRVGKTFDGIVHGKEIMWRDMPIVARFMGDAPNTHLHDFYDIVGQIDTEDTAAKGGKPFDANALAYKKAAAATAKQISDLRKAGQDDAADTLAAQFIKAYDKRRKR